MDDWVFLRQLLLGVTRAASIDQYACMTAKIYAALTPNSRIPSTASRAPIICQYGCSVRPEAPRVLIEGSKNGKVLGGRVGGPKPQISRCPPHPTLCSVQNGEYQS